MTKKLRFVVACAITFCLIFAMAPAAAFAADLTATKYVDSFSSNNSGGTEQVDVTTSGSTVTVEYKSALKGVKYRVGLREIGKTGSWMKGAYQDLVASNTGFTAQLNTSYQPDGTYYLLVARAANETQAQGYDYIGGSHGYVFIGVPIKVSSGTASVVEYSAMMSNNESKRAASAKKGYKRYVTKSAKALSDIAFVFTGYDKKKPSESTRRTYFKKVSDSVVGNTKNSYEKMRKLYTYVTSNFYYDTIAFANSSKQHINPYLNLKKYRDNLSSTNSVKTSGKKAKVATTCVGYSAMLIALARAQNIPAKLVYGHSLTSPWNTWTTESDIKSRDHWWVEVYLDGRWMIMDPTRGTNATWNRTTNKWEKKAADELLTYNYFDPSMEFFSNTHYIHGYKS
ncbi:MAG: transglutaminase family protein [Coriobacteriales bacterium]